MTKMAARLTIEKAVSGVVVPILVIISGRTEISHPETAKTASGATCSSCRGPNISIHEYVFIHVDNKVCYLNIIVLVIFLVTAVPVIYWVSLSGDWPAFFLNDALTDASDSAIIWLFGGNSIENNRKETNKEILHQGCQCQEQESF